MKNAIREFLDLKDSEKADLWNNATFVFDTNVYLDLYRYSQKTRTVLLEAMSQLSERIWMPNHVAHEFMKDRVEVIFDTINRHETMKPEIDKIVKLFSGILRFKENEPEVMQLRNQLESWVTSNEEKNLLVKDVANDPVLDKILTLYEGKVGTAIDETELEKIKEEGKARYEKLIPPGYKDAHKLKAENDRNAFGDLIIWKEILRYSATQKKNIIFITEDGKEDWWYIFRGRTLGPRIELKKEFFETTNQLFHMYSLDGFLRHLNGNIKDSIDPSIIDEVQYLEKRYKKDPKYIYDAQFEKLSDRLGKDNASKFLRMHRQTEQIDKKNSQRRKTIESWMKKYDSDNIPQDIQEQIANVYRKIELEEKRKDQLLEKMLYLQLHS